MPEKYGRTTGSSIFHPKEGLHRLVHSLCQNYMNKHPHGTSALYEQARVGSSELFE